MLTFMLGHLLSAAPLVADRRIEGSCQNLTFALDKNPVCSILFGSKLTGEPAIKNPQGRGDLKCKRIYLQNVKCLIQIWQKLKLFTDQKSKHQSFQK